MGTPSVGARWVARGRGAGYRPGMTPPSTPSYAGHRFPPAIIGHAVWLYFRFPLGLRMVEEMLAARGITVSHETVRQWALKRAGSVCLNRLSGLIGGASAGFRPPRSAAAG